MKRRILGWAGALMLAAPAAAVTLAAIPAIAAEQAISLSKLSHIHGLAAAGNGEVLVATHYGIFRARPDGTAVQLSKSRDDFMGFTPHPKGDGVFFGSGHPQGGGNLGLVTSTDGGKTWMKLAAGDNGPADFHNMDVSKADPNVIYGVYRGLQVSKDGGKTWETVAAAPQGLIDFAASAKQVDRLYAGTQTGLQISKDGGKSWGIGYLLQRPVTTVHVTPDGIVYAFVVGQGLIRSPEPGHEWVSVSPPATPDAYLLYLVDDPSQPGRLYAVDEAGTLRVSEDGGKIWRAFGAKS